MKKLTIVTIIILTLGGVGYYLYLTDSPILNFLNKGSVPAESVVITENQANEKEQEAKAEKEEVRKDKTDLVVMGDKINGDFNGDGNKELASLLEVENGIYEIQFSDKNIPPIQINVEVWHPYLIYQGDLSGDDVDDIVLQTQTENRKIKFYSFSKNKWTELSPKFYVAFEKTISVNNHEFRVTVEKSNATRPDSFRLIISTDRDGYDFNDYLFLDSDIVQFIDLNNDKHTDIKLTESKPEDTCVESYNPAQYYLFDPEINLFRKINTLHDSWYMSQLFSNYYMEREYNPCKGISKYHLFKLENYEPVYKGYVDFGYKDEKGNDNLHYKNGRQVVYIYKGNKLIETLFVDDGTYSGSTKYIKSSQSYLFDEEKYFSENLKKFE